MYIVGLSIFTPRKNLRGSGLEEDSARVAPLLLGDGRGGDGGGDSGNVGEGGGDSGVGGGGDQLDDGAALVQEILREAPKEERGVREEWAAHVGWHRKGWHRKATCT